MKLSKEEVEKISNSIVENLKKKNLIAFKAEEDFVLGEIIRVFTSDLAKEDILDREVEDILSKHSNEIDIERIDYRRMFSMIKTKLARERGIVL